MENYPSSMRAVLEDLRSGDMRMLEVPVPELRPGGVLVRTAFSAVSTGTERAKVEASEKSLLGKAMARPDLVKQVIDFAKTNGIRAAYEKVQSKLDTLSPMGYSCSGRVIAVGEGVTQLRPGDRVACGGVGYANHSEINWVPVNLTVRIPDQVSLEAASLTTIGAIAIQGLRQAQVSFGETVLVVGAGLVGVLTMQLARAAGCRVIAADVDASRVQKAQALGANLALLSSDERFLAAVEEFSRYGPDAAIVTAATPSADPLELAAKAVRDRGRIVVVGIVGMGVSRPNMYHKEITLAMSRSYGPGRYDPAYEEGGNDYPVGYVRWTEQRNMEAFLDLLASGALDLSALLEKRYPIKDAGRAYSDLISSKSYTAILEYPESGEAPPVRPEPRSSARRERQLLRVGCVGAGGFAQTHIFPSLKASNRVSLESVATASGVTAESARRNFGFARTHTSAGLVQDPQVDAVFITSRHQSHAQYVAEALRNGKAVFVEKPLCIDRRQMELVKSAYQEARNPFVMVGFNRRFAPFSARLGEFFRGRREPMMMNARINAGFLPAEHWTQQPGEGGRIVGEMCHFIDWARSVVGSAIRTVRASALPDGSRYHGDNVAATLAFADGSIANVTYLANGDASVPKELFEVFCDGMVARLEDFVTLDLTRNRKTQHLKAARDKGHRQEIKLTVEAMLAGKGSPIPFPEIIEVTEATFAIVEAVASGQPASVEDPLVLASGTN